MVGRVCGCCHRPIPLGAKRYTMTAKLPKTDCTVKDALSKSSKNFVGYSHICKKCYHRLRPVFKVSGNDTQDGNTTTSVLTSTLMRVKRRRQKTKKLPSRPKRDKNRKGIFIPHVCQHLKNGHHFAAIRKLLNHSRAAKAAAISILQMTVRREMAAYTNAHQLPNFSKENVENFNWSNTIETFQEKMPTAFAFLIAMMCTKSDEPISVRSSVDEEPSIHHVHPRLGMMFCVALFTRCPRKFSFFQTCTAVEMWRHGVSKKLFKMFNNLGICQSTSTASAHWDKLGPEAIKDLIQFKLSIEDSEVSETEPPKKKTKVDDKSDGEQGQSTSGQVQHEEPDQTEDKSPAEDSGKAVGASSGYVREEESDDEGQGDAETAPPSPDNIRDNIKNKFLVEMPEDFYDFWELAKNINSKNPSDALMSSLGLQLVGPFDILAGAHKNKRPKGSFLTHWRYYYDPPEFQTILRGDDATQYHLGYFRDDPSELPVFVASNAAKTNGSITSHGENVFAAVHWFIEDKMKKEKQKGGPLAKLKDRVADAAKKGNYSLELKTKNMKAREKKVVCKSFHGAGIVVPVDENEVGYREVPESPADLKKMFKKIVDAKSGAERDKAMDPLMEIIMLVQFANDECDYGEGLELGMDMFSYGGDGLHKMILNLLPLAYQLLRRPQFGQIVQAHLSNRKHTVDLSVL